MSLSSGALKSPMVEELSGARSRMIPMLLFEVVTARVQRVAFQMTSPIEWAGAEPRLQVIAPAERRKSRYPASSNEAPGWMFPTFRDVASHTHAVWTQRMMMLGEYFRTLLTPRNKPHDLARNVHPARCRQRLPPWHGVDLDHVQLAAR